MDGQSEDAGKGANAYPNGKNDDVNERLNGTDDIEDAAGNIVDGEANGERAFWFDHEAGDGYENAAGDGGPEGPSFWFIKLIEPVESGAKAVKEDSRAKSGDNSGREPSEQVFTDARLFSRGRLDKFGCRPRFCYYNGGNISLGGIAEKKKC